MRYRLGTRKSDLALTQSRWVQQCLKKIGIECELVPILSRGDQDQNTALYQAESATPGWFTKQLETALLNQEIDLAVHSLKDLPTVQPPELRVACIPERRSAADYLLIHPEAVDANQPLQLALGAHVGTSSLRREAELLSARSDLKVSPVRGNIPTRLDKVRRREFDAIVFAYAGLDRLGVEPAPLHVVPLEESVFVPAPGQGALGVEIRTDAPKALVKALEKLHNATVAQQTRIEREILRQLEGGCTLPLGVRCWNEGDGLRLSAFLGHRTESQAGRTWQGFDRFDISGSDEQYLVAETVAHFRKE